MNDNGQFEPSVLAIEHYIVYSKGGGNPAFCCMNGATN